MESVYWTMAYVSFVFGVCFGSIPNVIIVLSIYLPKIDLESESFGWIMIQYSSASSHLRSVNFSQSTIFCVTMIRIMCESSENELLKAWINIQQSRKMETRPKPKYDFRTMNDLWTKTDWYRFLEIYNRTLFI